MNIDSCVVGLRLFVAASTGQDQRLLRRAPGVSGVERRAQVGDRLEACRKRPGGEGRVGIAAEQVAAQAQTATCISPRPAASMQAIVSSAGDAGSCSPSCSSRLSQHRLLSAAASRRPSPCPARCCGRGSAAGRRPGRPTMPRSSARLTIIRTLSTPCTWWVMPIVQPKTTSFAAMYISATSAIGLAADACRRARCRSHGVALDLPPNVSKPSVCCLDEGAVVTAALEHVFRDAGEEGDVAADVRLHVQAGDARSRTAGYADRTAPGS